jgi:hypothetical protein
MDYGIHSENSIYKASSSRKNQGSKETNRLKIASKTMGKELL